jgi:hypothetical protein
MIQIILQKLSSKDVYLKLTEPVYLNEGLLMIWEFVFSFAINISTVGPMPQKLRNLVIIKSTLKA